MPPNKDEQPRRGNGSRRPAEPRSSNIQDESNAASQPTVPQPIPAQTSTRQIPSGVNHNNAQRPSQRPGLSYSDVVQNKPSLPQSSGDGSSTLPQSAARQSSSVANQNKAQRPRQQPAPNVIPPSCSNLAKNNMNPPQRLREDLPIQAQSSTRHDSNVGNQNNAPRLAQTTNSKSIPASNGNVAGNNMNPPQRSVGPSQHPSNIGTGDLPRATRPPWPAGNQAKPEKRLFRPYQSSASRETDNSKEAPKIYGGRDGVIPTPNKDVNQVEDDFIKSGLVPNQLDSKFCVRPAYGSWGTSITLWTNYLELELPSKGLSLHSYDMIVEPEVKTRTDDDGNKPESDKKKIPKGEKRRQLIKVLLNDPVFKAKGSAPIATDFNTTLITKGELDLGKGKREDQEGEFTVEYKPEGLKSASPERYTIRVKLAAVRAVSDFIDYLNPKTKTSDYNKSLIEGDFNVILGHYTKQSDKITRVGCRKIFPFSPALAQNKLDNGLIALRGYFTCAIGATSRILVNVNISHGAFYDGIPLKHLIWEYSRGEKRVEQLHQFLKRLRVKTTHLSANDKAFGKIRTISGLAMKTDGVKLLRPPSINTNELIGGSPYQVEFYEDPSVNSAMRSSFLESQSLEASRPRQKSMLSREERKRYTTVSAFFRKAYPKVEVAQNLDRRLPVVNVGTKAIPIYLPAEVCEVLPGQVSPYKLNSRQTRNMINFAKCDPSKCAELIAEEGRKTLGYDPPSESMVGFEMATSGDLITVPGRILTTPEIEYKPGGDKPFRLSPSEGSWNIGQLKLYQPVEIEQCYIWKIENGDEFDNLSSEGFRRSLGKFGESMAQCGIKSDKPQDISLVAPPELENRLRKFLSKSTAPGKSTLEIPTGAKTTPKPRLLVIILPSMSQEPYNTIKCLADRELGFHTVCVTGEKDKKLYANNPEQYNANVMLKINLKLGGINHKLGNNAQALGPIGEGTTMVVGIDVTHPSPGSREMAPSIFAIVASMDPQLSQWPVRFGVQKNSREEVISNRSRLIEMFQELLKVWKRENGDKYPENIVIYRDGVSEGQYSAVMEQELTALREACNTCSTINPRMTLIVVAKRHHTRFYPTKSNHADSTNNAKCGTVVDRGITQAQTWDFFLQSHSVIKGGRNKPSGTARPAHYVVLHDEVFGERFERNPAHKADQLQQITYNMSYLYGPATKAISICPPVYLADKACTRARLYLNDAFSPPSKDEIAKRKDKKDEKDETPEEKEQREKDENKDLQDYQNRIEVREDLKDTMFYI